MWSMSTPGLFARLEAAERVLVAGAGGGFDIFAGLPLALALRNAGKDVTLASYSFSDLGDLDLDSWIEPGLALVTTGSSGNPVYFPEGTLARWLAARKLDVEVYAFPRTGVAPLRDAYATLMRRLGLDAVVLVDGGTDILMRGDEEGLGTPHEDMTSLAAVASLSGHLAPERLLACIGFGVDAHHGVCHAHVLENIATLESDGAYLGAFSVPGGSDEGQAYLDAVSYARAATPDHPSIVNGQIAAAVSGKFGDVYFTDRTARNELFVNPLMAIYFTFDLSGVAKNVHYLDALSDTRSANDVALAIEAYRYDLDDRRPRRPIPH